MLHFDTPSVTAFAGEHRLVSGLLPDVVQQAKEFVDNAPDPAIHVFSDGTGARMEIDFRGTLAEVLARLPQVSAPVNEGSSAIDQTASPGPGRPRLGVVAREVTLLPRHWEWLNDQPGGASVALRKLVDEARRANSAKDRVRQSQEATYRFIVVMCGNLPGFEEATRALFAGNLEGFQQCISSWPTDIQNYANRLAVAAFTAPDG
jgi:hypothetical protein